MAPIYMPGRAREWRNSLLEVIRASWPPKWLLHGRPRLRSGSTVDERDSAGRFCRSHMRTHPMRFARSATGLWAALVVTAQAAYASGQQAQDSSQGGHDSRDIVVTGKRGSPDRTIAQTRAISNPHDGQLAGFETPICPTVVGLPRAQAAVIERGIREVADRAEIRTDSFECSPNLTIVIAGDGGRFVNLLRRARPTLFNTLSLAELNRLRNSPGPSWTWKSISPERRDGGPVETISQIEIDNRPPQRVSSGGYIARNVQLSRLTMPVRQKTDLAFVVLDLDQTMGLTLRQVADYSAMVGLAAIRTDKTDTLARISILSMYQDHANGQAAQPGITAFDLSYLTALYAGDSGYSSDQKSIAIAGQIIRKGEP